MLYSSIAFERAAPPLSQTRHSTAPPRAEECRMPPSITPQQFVAKWRGDTRKERSVSQEHFIDLCRLLGHPTLGESRDGSLAFEEILARLLALNLGRAAGQGGAAADDGDS